MNIQTKLETEEKNNSNIKFSSIICPNCGESVKIKFNEYKIKLYGCKNGHNIDNILIDEFEKIQELAQSKKKYKNEFLFNDTTSYDKIMKEEKEIQEKMEELRAIINLFISNIEEIVNTQ